MHMRNLETLLRLRGCVGRSASSMFAYSIRYIFAQSNYMSSLFVHFYKSGLKLCILYISRFLSF